MADEKNGPMDSGAASDFITMIAHQLRTPLTSAKWSLESLLDEEHGQLTIKQRKLISQLHGSNQQLITLLEEMMEASRNNTFQLRYEFTKGSLGKILNSIIDEMKHEANAKNVSITLQTKEDHTLRLDREKITFAFENIIENAIKYNREGGSVTISTSKDNNLARIAIADTGIGIPANVQEKVFTKFFRAENAKTHIRHGSGLGIYTAKSIIEAHGGSLSFESTEGKGTTFFVVLPL